MGYENKENYYIYEEVWYWVNKDFLFYDLEEGV